MREPDFWNDDGRRGKLAKAALRPVGWAYAAAVRYKAANAKPYRSSAKVICVGNLTAGGTGKTPISIAIARALIERQRKVRIITRGYGGRVRGPAVVHPKADSASEVGDEALLLAAAAPVIVARDRAEGAKLAEQKGVDIIVMDDGHQNFTLAKDLSLIVVDSELGFGNGRILPAGPLREPVESGLARADAIVLTGDGEINFPAFDKPVLRAHLVPVDVLGLEGKRVIAFAGIGRPMKFFDTLRRLGADIVEEHAFPDHHVYSPDNMGKLRHQAHSGNAILITTEKDFVRLPPAQRLDVRYLPVRAMFEDLPALMALLDRVAPPPAGADSP
jgi:tetraacyldisaccharide 4'-kinase